MTEHHNAEASRLLGQLKDFLALASDPHAPPLPHTGDPTEPERVRRDVPGLYAPVSDALDHSMGPHAKVWPKVAISNLKRLLERVESGEGWSAEPRREQARVCLLLDWLEVVGEQVDLYHNSRGVFDGGAEERVEFVTNATSRIRAKHQSLMNAGGRGSAVIESLFKIEPHLAFILSHQVWLNEMGNKGRPQKCIERMVRNALDLELELIGLDVQLVDWDNMLEWAKALEHDTIALQLQIGASTSDEVRGVVAEEQIGRRAARRYGIDRSALTRETVWPRMM